MPRRNPGRGLVQSLYRPASRTVNSFSSAVVGKSSQIRNARCAICHLALRAQRVGISNSEPFSETPSPETGTFEQDKQCNIRVACSIRRIILGISTRIEDLLRNREFRLHIHGWSSGITFPYCQWQYSSSRWGHDQLMLRACKCRCAGRDNGNPGLQTIPTDENSVCIQITSPCGETVLWRPDSQFFKGCESASLLR